MLATRRTARYAVAVMLAVGSGPSLRAGLCPQHNWALSELADAPILAVGRVVSLSMQLPHFTGDPKTSAPGQTMSAEVQVLRFFRRDATSGTPPPEELQVRFLGRDGPDFGFCPQELPKLEPGQVLLLPLRSQMKGSSEPWQLAGVEGYGMTMRVAGEMGEPAVTGSDARSFIVRELVNSLSHGDPMARYSAASRVATEGDYLEPDLTSQLKSSLGNDTGGWARVLGGILLNYPHQPVSMSDVLAVRTGAEGKRFKGIPLAQLALARLPSTAQADTLVWQGILADLPAFADEPNHPLFSYESSFAMRAAVRYLSRYHEDAGLLEKVKTALKEDSAGSSDIAGALIGQGQRELVPDALDRAMKVVRRPEASDVFPAIMLILEEGSDEQRRQFADVIGQFRSINPDYAAFLQLKLNQTPSPRP